MVWQLPILQNSDVGAVAQVARCRAIANTDWHGQATGGFSWLEVPHKPVLDLPKGGLHGPILLRHFETTLTRRARLL